MNLKIPLDSIVYLSDKVPLVSLDDLFVAPEFEGEDPLHFRRGVLQRLAPIVRRQRPSHVDLSKRNAAAVAGALRMLYPPIDVPAVLMSNTYIIHEQNDLPIW